MLFLPVLLPPKKGGIMKLKFLVIIVMALSFATACRKENIVAPKNKLERSMDGPTDSIPGDTGGEDKPKPVH